MNKKLFSSKLRKILKGNFKSAIEVNSLDSRLIIGDNRSIKLLSEFIDQLRKVKQNSIQAQKDRNVIDLFFLHKTAQGNFKRL